MVAAELCIVLPVFNEEAALPQALAALRPLRARGVRVVVADGGSVDASWRIACAAADAVVAAPRGRASQMNAGARAALGARVLLFLHADTRLPPQAERLVAQALAGGARWGRFDVRLDSPRALLRLVAALVNLRSRWTGIATGDQAIFVRRELFEAENGFADLPLMEDVELSTRLRRHARPACLRARATTSARRWERHGVLRTIVLMWSLRLRYWLGTDPQTLAERYGYAPRPSLASAAIAVLAKAPVPGLAKTRLAHGVDGMGGIGAVAAARAQRGFTLQMLHAARAADIGPLRLWCAPDPRHRFFRALARQRHIDLSAQPGGDLGARMQAICAAHFDAGTGLPLLLVGTDCPLLSPGQLQAAARELAAHDAVLIPAEDGGYVLLGLAHSVPGVFEGIAWSTPQVLALTRERLRAAGARWRELPALWDVDEPPDWARLQRLLALDERAFPE